MRDEDSLQFVDFSAAISGVDGISEVAVVYSHIIDGSSILGLFGSPGSGLLGILGLAAAGVGVGSVGFAVGSHNGGGNGSSPPPSSPLPSLPSGVATITAITNDTGSNSNDFITNDNTLIISGTVTGLAGGEDVQIRIVNSAGVVIVNWVNATVVGTSWSYDNQSMVLADGNYTIEVQVINSAGNVNTGISQSLEVDTSAPTGVTLSIGGISDDTGISGSDFITNDQTLLINGSVTGLSSGENVQIRILDSVGNVIVAWTDAAVSGASWFFDNQGMSLAGGNYSIEAQVIDVAGNVGTMVSQALEIDITAPSGAAVSITGITNDTGISGSDFITSDQTLIIAGTVAGLNTGEWLEIRIIDSAGNEIVGWNMAAISNGAWNYDNQLVSLAGGNYTIETRVVDMAGNATATASQALVIDLATVAITHISDDNGWSGTDFITNDTSLIFYGTASGFSIGDAVQVRLVDSANAEILTWTTVSVVNGVWSYDNQANYLNSGDYVIETRIIDAGGNPKIIDTQALSINNVLPIKVAEIDETAFNVPIFFMYDNGWNIAVSGSNQFKINGDIYGPSGLTALTTQENIAVKVINGSTYETDIYHNVTVTGSSFEFDFAPLNYADGVYYIEFFVENIYGSYFPVVSYHQLTINTSNPLILHEIKLSDYALGSGNSLYDNAYDNIIHVDVGVWPSHLNVYLGGGGADTIVIEDYNARIGVMDFTFGVYGANPDVDRLDISHLTSIMANNDPGWQNNMSDFLKIDNGNTLYVDFDGSSGPGDWRPVAYFDGVSGLDILTMIAEGTLVI